MAQGIDAPQPLAHSDRERYIATTGPGSPESTPIRELVTMLHGQADALRGLAGDLRGAVSPILGEGPEAIALEPDPVLPDHLQRANSPIMRELVELYGRLSETERFLQRVRSSVEA